MISWVGAVFLVVGFIVLAKLLGMVEKSKEAIDVTRRSLNVIRDPALGDDVKEKTLQKNSLRLFRLFFALSFAGAAALLLPVGVLWLGQWMGWLSLDAVFGVAVSPLFLVLSTVFACLALFRGSKRVPSADDYPTLDRILHRIAFRTTAAQVAAADVEDKMFSKQLARCKLDRPVFITALPRAGTTLLLECCAKMPEFAAHCYRDMPFVLIPVLWGRFSAKFRKEGRLRQRAHGDGMLINFDSPEALEEVVWKAFWRRQYGNDRIIPWRNESNEEFEDFFRSHMRKIIHLRRGEGVPRARYLSKNNLNVARIPLLRRIFPDSIIVVPFRDPVQHAASLLKQHRNFLHIHAEDKFASRYMRAIGHFDFGENLRPVDFGGWFDNRRSKDPESIAFWLEYWAAGYEHLVRENAAAVRFIGFDALCEHPQSGLKALAGAVGAAEPDRLLAEAAGIRAPQPHDVDLSAVPDDLAQDVERIHGKLKELSLNPTALPVAEAKTGVAFAGELFPLPSNMLDV